MSSVGKINLDLNVNSKKFSKQIDGISKVAKQKCSVLSVAMGNIFANMATKMVSSFGNAIKDCLDKGSELSELQNVVDVVFPSMSSQVESFAKNALESYGLTEAQSKKMVGTFGAMSKSFNYTEKQAFGMATQLTALTADVASFYNLDHDVAYTKMKSVFTGETESLKELGVVMTQNALDQFALANGYGKTTSKMSEQEKVALRLAFVQNKLNHASGDFIRTQDSWANQTRILTGQIESFKAAIGQGLINVLTPVIRVINTILAKLVQLANAFKSFTAMIMGVKSSSGGVGSAMKDVADSATNAADAAGGIGDAAAGAAKKAKKAQKDLMGFDEINKLSAPPEDSGGGGGGGGGLFDDIDFGEAIEEQENKTNEALDKIKQKIKELVDLFREGFKAGLGDDFENSIQRMKQHIDNIGKSLKEIFTDPLVVNAADNWAKTVAYSLGQIAGSMVSIGMSIAENLLGGVDKYLEQNKQYIKDRLVGIFDESAKIWEISGNLAQAIASIFEVFRGDTAKQCTADLIGIFANAKLGITELALRIGGDVLNCIAQPIIDNQDKIKVAIENTLKPISTVLGTLNTSVKETFEKIFQVYEAKISPMFQKIAEGLSSIAETLLDKYNTYIAPVLDRLSEKFKTVWESSIQPMINKAIELIGKIANAIGTLFKGVITPLINWLISTIIPVLAPVIENIGNVVIGVIGAICTILGGLFDVLGGIIDFIVGVFSGNWQLAWEGIKSIFEGIWGIICGLFQGVWEIIKGIVTAALLVIKGLIELVWNGIVGFFTAIWNVIVNLFTTVLGALVGLCSSGFQGMANVITTITNAISIVLTTVWNAIKAVLTTIWNGIKATFTTVWNAIKLFITTITNAIKTVITTIWRDIKTTVLGIVNGIKVGVTTGFSTLKNAVTGCMNTLKSTVIGIFQSMWAGIKGVINTILGGIEKLVNGVIGGLNKMTSALNNLKFDVPDWVPGIGGKKFGMSIPSISTVSLPRLAEGGYVRANQPQPVIVGDNRTQGEIITPEGKMLDVMIEALETFFSKLMSMGYSNQKAATEFGDLVIPIYLDGTILDEVIVTAQQRRNLRSGGR